MADNTKKSEKEVGSSRSGDRGSNQGESEREPARVEARTISPVKFPAPSSDNHGGSNKPKEVAGSSSRVPGK